MEGVVRSGYKIVTAICLIAFTAIGLSGCGKKSVSSSNANKTTLTIWRAADNDESFQDIIKAYQQQNPNVVVNYVYNAEWKNNPDLYLQQSIDALATGKGPDIWSIRNDWMTGQYLKLRPVPKDTLSKYTSGDTFKGKSNKEILSSLFVPVVSTNCLIGDDVYGLPLSVDSLALYINQNILDNAADELSQSNKTTKKLLPDDLSKIKKILSNGPKDWTELVTIVPYITTKNGNNISRSAVALGLGSNIEQAPDIISTLLLQNGTKIVTDDDKSAYFQNAQGGVSTPSYPGQGAIKFYTRFSNAKDPLYSWNTDFASSARQAFLDGKLAMIFEDSSFYATIKASKIKFTSNIIPMPQLDTETPKSYASYWVEAVTNNSKVPGLAWDFLEFATTSSNVGSYLSNTKRPPALAARSTTFQQDLTQQAVFTAQATVAQTWFKGPYPNQTDQIFRNWADNIAIGGKSVQEATNTAAGQLTTILQRSSLINPTEANPPT